jgi:hypothetical protein
MGPLVRKIDGVWTEWNGHNEPMPKTVNTCVITYADGRSETEECEPYQVLVTLSASAMGGWSAEELAEFGLKRAVLFEVPTGKVAVGAVRYVEDGDSVRQVYDVEDAPPYVEPVPESISPLQARKALRAVGLMDAVKAYVATLSEEEQEEWEYATEIRRNNHIIASGAAALEMTPEQIDDLFRLGVTL